MREQRRHQRIRFNMPPRIRLGQSGSSWLGRLENLSLGGLLVRSDQPLKTGEIFGCEFSIFGSVLIDIPAIVVGRISDLYSARFQPGPISEQLLIDEISRSMSSGRASVLSVNDVHGRRIMRVTGGLNNSLRNDFMHALDNMGVVGVDLSEVKDIDRAGAELCRVAIQDYRIDILRPSCRISPEVAAITGWPKD
jgi:hypothetical protein